MDGLTAFSQVMVSILVLVIAIELILALTAR